MSAELEHRQQELRERILDATLRVIRERGMARTRTNAIAKAAGCSEGSIYRYFSGKPELLHEVVRTRLQELMDLLSQLPARAGTASVAANLREVVREASSFYGEVVPLYAGVFADAELREGECSLLVRGDLGPRTATRALTAYLRAEQRLGRVRPTADAEVAARLLLSSCLGETFARALSDTRMHDVERERYIDALVQLVMCDLRPSDGGAS